MLTCDKASILDEAIPSLSEKLSQRFQSIFPVPEGPNHSKLLAFSQAITSNLMGGIGYFYGRSIVDKGFAYEWDEEEADEDSARSANEGARLTEPKELLTATPSRSFFPRGFYWYGIVSGPVLN
jgi:mannosyl-oligosaccharide glucosidase